MDTVAHQLIRDPLQQEEGNFVADFTQFLIGASAATSKVIVDLFIACLWNKLVCFNCIEGEVLHEGIQSHFS